MPAPMSVDLRLRIVRAVERRQLDPRGRAPLCGQPVGGNQADAAGARDRQRRPGALRRLSPARCSRRMRPTCARLVEAKPDITLAELQAALQRRCGIVPGSRRSTTRCAGSA